jgi:hypothetical protein
MKKSTKPFSLVIILLIAFASCQDKPENQKDTEIDIDAEIDTVKALTYVPVSGKKYIVLLVNTAELEPGDSVKNYSSFPDMHGVSVADYETDVFPGDSVIWIGVSTSAPTEDKVEMKMINHRSGANVLGPLRAENGMVKGIIKVDAKPGQQETYVIHFRVIKDGSPPAMYIHDPILRVH